MSWKKNYNPKVSVWAFILSAFFCVPLSGMVFSARPEDIVEHTFERVFFLALGILTPMFLIIGIVFLLISYYQYQSFSTRAKAIMFISFIYLFLAYFIISLESIIKLIKML